MPLCHFPAMSTAIMGRTRGGQWLGEGRDSRENKGQKSFPEESKGRCPRLELEF